MENAVQQVQIWQVQLIPFAVAILLQLISPFWGQVVRTLVEHRLATDDPVAQQASEYIARYIKFSHGFTGSTSAIVLTIASALVVTYLDPTQTVTGIVIVLALLFLLLVFIGVYVGWVDPHRYSLKIWWRFSIASFTAILVIILNLIIMWLIYQGHQ